MITLANSCYGHFKGLNPGGWKLISHVNLTGGENCDIWHWLPRLLNTATDQLMMKIATSGQIAKWDINRKLLNWMRLCQHLFTSNEYSNWCNQTVGGVENGITYPSSNTLCTNVKNNIKSTYNFENNSRLKRISYTVSILSHTYWHIYRSRVRMDSILTMRHGLESLHGRSVRDVISW